MRMTFMNRIRVKIGAKWNRNRMLRHKMEIERENFIKHRKGKWKKQWKERKT